jgi:hypothetical protein
MNLVHQCLYSNLEQYLDLHRLVLRKYPIRKSTMAPSLIEDVAPQTLPVQELMSNAIKTGIPPSCCVSEVDPASSTTESMLKVDNPSLQVTKDHTIKMVEAPILKPGPHDVLLHVKVTGICGYLFVFTSGTSIDFCTF